MLDTLSQADKALVDTLIHKSTGAMFDSLSEMYGFSRPSGFSEQNWRHALRAVAFGQRGTLGTTWAALELGLRSEPESQTVVVTMNPATPHRLTFVSGTGAFAGGFTCLWVGRFVRLRYAGVSKILYTVGPSTAAPPVAFVDLAPIETGLWTIEDGADLDGVVTTCSLELLPFMVSEPGPGPLTELPVTVPTLPDGSDTPLEWLVSLGERCLVDVLISAEIYPLPPTYLLDPAGVDRNVVDPNEPDGGIIMDLHGAINDTTGLLAEVGDPLGVGPYPIYLLEEATTGVLTKHFDPILAAGVDVAFGVRDFCLFEGVS